VIILIQNFKSMGSFGFRFRAVPSTLDHNVTNVVDLNTLLEKREKTLAR
jgi:hypothetical protein